MNEKEAYEHLINKVEKEAYNKGQKDMRERAAKCVYENSGSVAYWHELTDIIRALPTRDEVDEANHNNERFNGKEVITDCGGQCEGLCNKHQGKT